MSMVQILATETEEKTGTLVIYGKTKRELRVAQAVQLEHSVFLTFYSVKP